MFYTKVATTTRTKLKSFKDETKVRTKKNKTKNLLKFGL